MALKHISPKSQPSIHFVGIGGIGVSSLARYFLAQNWRVTGSDSQDSELIHELRRDGANVKIGHSAKNLPSLPRAGSRGYPEFLVYSQAIRPENPERIAAHKHNISEISYPQMIGMLSDSFRTIAVAGAHGKSTTSAMIALVLTEAKFDPTVIIGTKVREFGGSNFRAGQGKYLVLEADEYGRAFLNYTPSHVIVTNIDREHLDIYKDLRDIQNTFLAFLARTRPGGTLVLNRDCKELYALKAKVAQLAKRSKYRVVWYSSNPVKNRVSNGAGNSVAYRKVAKVLRVPGLHNRMNATAVFELAKALHIPEKTILRSLSKFNGTWRRMELRGFLHIPHSKFHIPTYDDYAHHPTEVRATLSALREKYPTSRIIAVFQPHQAKRLKLLFKEFTDAFHDADNLILIPMYSPAGRDTIDPKYTSESLMVAIRKKYPKKNVVYLPKLRELKQLLERSNPTPHSLHPTPCVLVFMGAGDITGYVETLLGRK